MCTRVQAHPQRRVLSVAASRYRAPGWQTCRRDRPPVFLPWHVGSDLLAVSRSRRARPVRETTRRRALPRRRERRPPRRRSQSGPPTVPSDGVRGASSGAASSSGETGSSARSAARERMRAMRQRKVRYAYLAGSGQLLAGVEALLGRARVPRGRASITHYPPHHMRKRDTPESATPMQRSIGLSRSAAEVRT